MELLVDKLANNYNSMGEKWQQDAKISRHQLLMVIMLIRASLKTGYKVKSRVVESEATTLNL
jgi:hypothetical protein